jgi:hypothetical protein
MTREKNVWELDERPDFRSRERDVFFKKNGYYKDTNPDFKIGETITFWTGYNNDIRAKATIKAVNGKDIYVYNDSYWYPIQNIKERAIKRA